MPAAAWLILPTYDEAENIEAIVARRAGRARARGARRPPDPRRRRRLARRHGRDRRPRSRPSTTTSRSCTAPTREGLGPAYLAGFARALDGGAQLVLEMDSDFSHDPADLARLLAAVAATPTSCSARATSPAAASPTGGACGASSAAAARGTRAIVLGLDVRDLTGGFKCFRREVLEAIDLPTVRSRGYAFQVELTHRAIHAGFRVVELPIVFRDRRLGRSKMSWRIAGEAALLVPQLRFARTSGQRRRR